MAKICDVETTNPSAVDITAASTPAPTSAANQVGNRTINNEEMASFGLAPSMRRASPNSARARIPPVAMSGSSMPKPNDSAMNLF